MALQPVKPTIGDLAVGAAARCAYNILFDRGLDLENKLQEQAATLVGGAIKMAQQNLPEQSIIEKAITGPLDKLLSNIEVPASKAIHDWLADKYGWLLLVCDERAKLTGQ